MKFKNYLNDLNEGLLHSDFSYGFEIEAISGIHTRESDVLRDFAKLNSIWGKGKIVDDASIEPYDKQDFPFEYVSPVIKISPSFFKEMEKIFNSLEKMGIYTNESCGLHFHVSFPHITIEDGFWILANLAKDDNQLKKIIKFKKHNFFNKDYVNVKFVSEIKKLLNTYDTKETLLKSTEGIKELERWNELFNRGKMRILRIHPQGTLEWRGPRDFLDSKQEVREFLFLLWDFVSWIITVMNKKELNGIKRKDFNEFLYKLDTKSFKLDLDHYIKDYEVEKMVFKIDKNDNFTWYSGVWYSGIFKNGTWKSGDWYDGEWIDNDNDNDSIWIKGRIYSNKFGKLLISKVDPNLFVNYENISDTIEQLKKHIK